MLRCSQYSQNAFTSTPPAPESSRIDWKARYEPSRTLINVPNTSNDMSFGQRRGGCSTAVITGGAAQSAFVGAGPRPARPAEGRRCFRQRDPRAAPARAGRGPAPTTAARSAPILPGSIEEALVLGCEVLLRGLDLEADAHAGAVPHGD